MNNKKNELLMFLGGLAMLISGLFILFNKVHISSHGWGYFSFGSFSMPSGLVVVPFIIGIVWMFSSNSFISKIFTAFSILLIVVAIIMNTRFWVSTMTMFDWLLILTLIFGGGAMVAKILFTNNSIDNPPNNKKKNKDKDN